MVLVIIIRVNISDYRREFACPYYHDNSLIRYTETWSLGWIYLDGLGSSLKNMFAFTRTVCDYSGNISFKQLPIGVTMKEIENLIDRRQAALMLRVTVATIDQLVKLELLQSHKIGSHQVFAKQFIQDFIEYLEEATGDKHEFMRKGFAS